MERDRDGDGGKRDCGSVRLEIQGILRQSYQKKKRENQQRTGYLCTTYFYSARNELQVEILGNIFQCGLMGLHRSYSFFCIRHILLFIPFCTESLAVRDRKIQPSKMYEYKCVCVWMLSLTLQLSSVFSLIFLLCFRLSILLFLFFTISGFLRWLFLLCSNMIFPAVYCVLWKCNFTTFYSREQVNIELRGCERSCLCTMNVGKPYVWWFILWAIRLYDCYLAVKSHRIRHTWPLKIHTNTHTADNNNKKKPINNWRYKRYAKIKFTQNKLSFARISINSIIKALFLTHSLVCALFFPSANATAASAATSTAFITETMRTAEKCKIHNQIYIKTITKNCRYGWHSKWMLMLLLLTLNNCQIQSIAIRAEQF